MEARSGGNGGLIWSAATDYRLPPHNWVPSFNTALTPGNRALGCPAPAASSRPRRADAGGGALRTVVFYGAGGLQRDARGLRRQRLHQHAAHDRRAGNVFFGFKVTGANPAGLESGIARVDADGNGTWASGRDGRRRSGDRPRSRRTARRRCRTDGRRSTSRSTPRSRPGRKRGYLLALDSTDARARSGRAAQRSRHGRAGARQRRRHRVADGRARRRRLLRRAREPVPRRNNARGWLLHFDAT